MKQSDFEFDLSFIRAKYPDWEIGQPKLAHQIQFMSNPSGIEAYAVDVCSPNGTRKRFHVPTGKALEEEMLDIIDDEEIYGVQGN